jgi:hypothetical protein
MNNTESIPPASCDPRPRPLPRALLLALLLGGPAVGSLSAGIPEPDLVWYGRVLTVAGGNTVRLTTGTLTWQVVPPGGGAPWVLTTQLTNINDQFSFVLRVPCESPEPGGTTSPNTVILTSPAGSYGRATVSLDGQVLTFDTVPTTFSPPLNSRGTTERIDLTLGSLPIDSDGDGMTDAWELLHFGTGGANPDDDYDHDGLSNLREFRAGTNPKDATSVFEVVDITPVSGGVRLRWSSVAGKIYRVRRSASLLASPTAYAILRSDIPASAPLNELTDHTVAGGTTFFYLIEVQP